MARITLIAPEAFDPELAEMLASKSPFELAGARVYAHLPEVAKAYIRFRSTLNAAGSLDRRLVELVRLRIAFHNQCRSCMAIRYQDARDAGVTEDLVCQLEHPDSAADLEPHERAALEFADLLAADHLAITDDTISGLRRYFTEPQIVELGMHVAYFVGYGRLAMAWDLVDDLPNRFRERTGDRITPWGGDEIVVGRTII